jgi:hypothetical protein
MTRKEAVNFIRQSSGKFFAVQFTKRTTGEPRTMICRTGVKSALKGGVRGYTDKEKQLLTVFDIQKMEYRTIPVEGIQWLMVNGVWRRVK